MKKVDVKKLAAKKLSVFFVLVAPFIAQVSTDIPTLDLKNDVTVITSSTRVRANNHSYQPAISANGRFVAFSSSASNLVPDDTNNRADVFVYDRLNQTIERVSVSSAGIQGNGYSHQASINADGRFVAFRSASNNLVPGDTNGTYDIFVHDRLNHTTERISALSAGIQGNYESSQPSISADGQFVAFRSAANNLVPNDNNVGYDIFVHDRLNHVTDMVSVSSTGIQQNSQSYEPVISSDGRFVVFRSWASNLVPGDTNKVYDIFVHDRLNHTTERVSISNNGGQGNGWSFLPSISSDGRFVTFYSDASNLVSDDHNTWADIFIRDRQANTTERISTIEAGVLGNTYEQQLAPISADGRYVTFSSTASTLVPDDTNRTADVFVYDRHFHSIERVSVSNIGVQGNNESSQPSISADGRFVAFRSSANNLVLDDFGWMSDVFVYDRLIGAIERFNVPKNATPEINRMISYPIMDYWYKPGTSTTRILTPMDILSLYSTGSGW